MIENLSFTARAIVKAQHLDITQSLRAQALTDYLIDRGRLGWDDERALWWVKPPDGPLQVAVWMMPVAMLFEPRKA